MKRRAFLKSGIVAGVGAACPGVLFLAGPDAAADAPDDAEHLGAAMIWCADSMPVPLRQNQHQASPISGPISATAHPDADQHAVFVKEFTLAERPKEALVRIFAYTRYRLYVNGIYSGRGPSRFQNQRPEYDTRSIASVLKLGKNLVTVLVHCDAPTGRIMRHAPGLAVAVQISGTRGTQTIATDKSWRARPDLSFGPRNWAWASIEEHIDGRKCVDFGNAELDYVNWPEAVPVGGPEFFPLWPRTTPLQQEHARLWIEGDTQLPLEAGPGSDLQFTLPEIVQGYHLLELDAEEGSEIEAAYQLPEGRSSGHSSCITRTGAQTWMGGDTFAFNRLSLRIKSGRIKIHNLQAVEVRYPFDQVASFECNDPQLNRLWKICARSLELLSEDSYVDCADRERVEWTDDSPPAFDCTRVMMRGPDDGSKTYWSDNRLLKALLKRIALTQQPDGQIKAHSCSDRWDIHAIMEDRSCDWVIQLREYFDSSGDRALVSELWPTLTRLMQWFLDRRTERGLVLAREWEVWDNPLRYQVCEGAGLNAFFYRALRDAAYLGAEIGETAAGKSFLTDADRLRANFNSLLWNATEQTYDGALFGPGSKTTEQLNGKLFPGPIVDGRYKPTTQAALLAIYCGIVPPDRVAPVRAWALAHLDGIQATMSHYYLYHMLYRMQDQVRDEDVLRTMASAWKEQIESPWQTTWEDLHGGSKAHIYGILPGFFLTAYVLGARREGPVSARSITIEPRCGELQWARGTAVTEFGPVEVTWKRETQGAFSVDCTVPPACSARLRIYRNGSETHLEIDGRMRRATIDGNFLELVLAPGRHSVKSR